MKFPQCFPTPQIKGGVNSGPLEKPEGAWSQGSHWGTYSLCTQSTRSQKSRRESLPGAQAPTGPSQGLMMAFGLRALSGPDCRHRWCQPPRRCHPGVHPRSAPCSLAGIASSAAQTGSQEALHPLVPGLLICPTPAAPSPLPRGAACRLFSALASQVTVSGSCPARGLLLLLLLLGNLTWKGNCPKHVGFPPKNKINSVHIFGEVGSLLRPEPWSRGRKSPRLPQDLEALVPSSVSSP